MAIIPVFQAEIFPHFHNAIMHHNGANAFLSVPWLDHQTRVDSSLHYFFSVRSFLSRSHMVVSFMQPRKSLFHLAGIDFATSLVGCTFKHFMSQFLAPCLSDKSDKWKYTFPADIPQEVLTKDPNRQLWSHLLRSVPTCWGRGGGVTWGATAAAINAAFRDRNTTWYVELFCFHFFPINAAFQQTCHTEFN